MEPQICMIKKLDNLKPLELPEGYSIHHFIEGKDEETWNYLLAETIGHHNKFDKFMKPDPAYAPENILFIMYDNKAIGMASAWFKERYGQENGYLHEVGVLKEHSGKGLGIQASLAALHRMKEVGRENCLLHTSDGRLAAIKTYLRMGYVPVITHKNQYDRWRDILKNLNMENKYDVDSFEFKELYR